MSIKQRKSSSRAGAQRRPVSWLRRGFKLLLGLLLLVLLLLAFVWFGLPRLALWAASSWYERQGDGYELQVNDWRFQPWQGKLALYDVVLRHPTSASDHALPEHQKTQLDTLELSIDMTALRAGQYRIVRLHVAGLALPVLQQQQTVWLAGLAFPVQVPVNEQEDDATTNAQLGDAQLSNDHAAPLALRVDDVDIRAITLHWQVEHTDEQGEQPMLAMNGRVVLDHLRLQQIDTAAFETVPLSWQLTLPALHGTQPLVVALEQPLVWQFDGEWQGGLNAPLLEGRSIVQDFALTMLGAPPLSFSRLSLDGLQLSVAEQVVQELSLSDLVIGEQSQPLFSLAHYHVDDIVFAEQTLSTGLQGFAGLQLHIERLADGAWLGVPASDAAPEAPSSEADLVAAETSSSESDLAADLAEPEDADTQALPDAQPRIHLAGVTQLSSDGKVKFRDGSVSPLVEKQIGLQQLQVESIQLDQTTLELLRPLVWHAQMTLDDFTRIEWDGTLSALNDEADMNMTLVIRQLDLVSFNAYITPILGYRLQRGLLDVDLDVAVNNGMLSGELSLRLRNSRFEPVDERTIQRLSQQISMPVETALSLLRDDDNVVRLTIPLSGSLQDPEMGFGDLTRQLSRLAIQSAAGFYLRQSLQPYGALVSLASYAGSELLAIRLRAIAFSSLSAELDADAQAYLTKVADIMHGKTNLQLRVCPFVSEEEIALLVEQKEEAAMTWQALAQQRGRAVRQFLAPLQDRDAQPLHERVSICVPQQGARAEVVMGF